MKTSIIICFVLILSYAGGAFNFLTNENNEEKEVVDNQEKIRKVLTNESFKQGLSQIARHKRSIASVDTTKNSQVESHVPVPVIDERRGPSSELQKIKFELQELEITIERDQEILDHLAAVGNNKDYEMIEGIIEKKQKRIIQLEDLQREMESFQ